MTIESLSAVTLATRDMPRAVDFYTRLGFTLVKGGAGAPFVSFAAGGGYLNLIAAAPGDAAAGSWGRVIFHVHDVDAVHAAALSAGLEPEFAPRDAPWGERYFHITDPDGHQVSLARPL